MVHATAHRNTVDGQAGKRARVEEKKNKKLALTRFVFVSGRGAITTIERKKKKNPGSSLYRAFREKYGSRKFDSSASESTHTDVVGAAKIRNLVSVERNVHGVLCLGAVGESVRNLGDRFCRNFTVHRRVYYLYTLLPR